MKHVWFIEILIDIRKFAKTQGMNELAERLDDAILIGVMDSKRVQEIMAIMKPKT